MKLSDAILLGSTLKPQGFGFGSTRPHLDRLCAFGAAYLALGMGGAMSDLYPWLDNLDSCPVCMERERIAWIISNHLNDEHRWTRERIALEFVRPLEALLEPVEMSWR